MDQLTSVLAALDISGGRDDDGNYVAISNREPAFCFVTGSEEESRRLIVAALESYAKVFFGEELKVSLQSETNSQLRPVRIDQRSRFRPTFAPSATLDGCAPAFA